MWEALRRRRAELDAWLTREGLAHTFSLPAWRLHRVTRPLVERHARGTCLDAGSGRSPWKPLLLARGARVLSLDVEDRTGEVDLVADLQDAPALEDEGFDTILCTQVLEHLPRPEAAVAEMARVLRDGGHLVVSVPHLSAIHEAPHDYTRFTRYGVRALLERHDFEVIALVEPSGLVAFLAHGASMALMTGIGALPGLRRIAWLLNYALLVRLAEPLDAVLGLRAVYPCDVVALARRRPRRPVRV